MSVIVDSIEKKMLIAILQNIALAVNFADTKSSLFSGNMGHPEPLKIVIFKKCPK